MTYKQNDTLDVFLDLGSNLIHFRKVLNETESIQFKKEREGKDQKDNKN